MSGSQHVQSLAASWFTILSKLNCTPDERLAATRAMRTHTNDDNTIDEIINFPGLTLLIIKQLSVTSEPQLQVCTLTQFFSHIGQLA